MSRSRNWDKVREQNLMRRVPRAPVLQTYKPPTAKQLKYLRYLADKTRSTFEAPQTSWDASQEIDRLKQLL